MSEPVMNEKDEKQFDEKAEKELRKHDEKTEERDTLNSSVWAAILIWAGSVFLAVNTGWVDRYVSGYYLSRILPEGMVIFEPGVWSIVAVGAGAILLLEVIIRMIVPSLHRNIFGTLILAGVFLGVGLGNFFGWDLIWPVILIVLGVSVLLGGVLRKKL